MTYIYRGVLPMRGKERVKKREKTWVKHSQVVHSSTREDKPEGGKKSRKGK